MASDLVKISLFIIDGAAPVRDKMSDFGGVVYTPGIQNLAQEMTCLHFFQGEHFSMEG